LQTIDGQAFGLSSGVGSHDDDSANTADDSHSHSEHTAEQAAHNKAFATTRIDDVCNPIRINRVGWVKIMPGSPEKSAAILKFTYTANYAKMVIFPAIIPNIISL